jgi:hypothetical protein
MKNRLLPLFLLLCSVGWLHADYHPKPEEIWPLIVRSQVIVIGTLDVPLKRIKECLTMCVLRIDACTTIRSLLKGCVLKHPTGR